MELYKIFITKMFFISSAVTIFMNFSFLYFFAFPLLKSNTHWLILLKYFYIFYNKKNSLVIETCEWKKNNSSLEEEDMIYDTR